MNRNRMFQGGLLFLALINCSDALAEKVSLGPVGQLHFSITIVNKSCEFEKADLEVDMGTMTLQKPIAVGRVLSKRDFTIALKDCGSISKASVTMDSVPDGDDDSLFALDTGGATGVALKIEDDKGTQQISKTAGGTAMDWPISGTTAKLNYRASYVVVNGSPTSGAANAMINFSVEYE
ncbi:TPA: long polar fimbrial protein LpfE [Escherichia albertii]|uniref:long polar fimbrial protein LpfE n=1 Tax=Escherichia albertii TaxID=208962 RepID=UPI001DA1CF45|nr:long polar fimbrial protein LpfE [Escherichia albertii]WDB39061.1 long polar fimbrial protein LpfE [Escherichia albertii]WKU80965.1 long polar fimbrial protein LpfE [Escherichia albertii]HAX3197660.1 long polar fimbrial protein LpfE [Escherichia albertii]HAX3201898.1 long polar fimbrial protein LpfE [Escherichia albertii]